MSFHTRLGPLIVGILMIGGAVLVGSPNWTNADANETAVNGANSPGQASITAGYLHTCALMTTGGVKCWGDNTYGQLGNNSNNNSSVPVDVQGLTSGVISISAGFDHTCAVMASGSVRCWGFNNVGQLGNGSTDNSVIPVDVTGLSNGVIAITGGGYHTCALLTTGAVRCWGWNTSGQLGDGTTTYKTNPVDVSGLQSGVSAITGGGYHTCALLSTGAAKCWGLNVAGQLGDNTNNDKLTPVDVSGLQSGVSAITGGGYHTCALLSTGAARCWGYNLQGQLGDGTIADKYVPVEVVGLSSGVVSITSDFAHTCALLDAGAVKCWGDNTYGQLGNSSNTDSSVPVNSNGLESGVLAITIGSQHSCALLINRALKCWGFNSAGQLGNNSLTNYNVPSDVNSLGSGVGRTTTTTTLPSVSSQVSAPQSTSYKTGNKKVTIQWSSVSGAASYVVKNAAGVVKCTSTTTSCDVASLRNGKLYTYAVYAANASAVESTSGTEVRVIPGFTLKKTSFTVKKSVKLSSIVTTPSKGKKTWQVTSGSCRLSGSKIVMPKKSGTCKVKLAVAKNKSYPAMSTSVRVAITK